MKQDLLIAMSLVFMGTMLFRHVYLHSNGLQIPFYLYVFALILHMLFLGYSSDEYWEIPEIAARQSIQLIGAYLLVLEICYMGYKTLYEKIKGRDIKRKE